MRHNLLPVALAAAFATAAGADDHIREQRIAFDAGASSATVTGTITGEEIIDYVLAARGGQTMEVEFATDEPGADFNVVPPGSDPTALDLGAEDASRWVGRLPYDGDYRVRVFLYRGAADNAKTANVTLDIAITGAPDPDAPPPPAFGLATFDARSELPCGADRAAFGGPSCPAKVVRYDGGATTWVQAPGGETRILYFEAGAFSTDTAETVAAHAEGDTWTVRVGDSEVYLVPEAWLFGG